MSLVSEEGILLRAHDYSETSRILRLLTPEHGLVSVMGRGLRRRMSRGEGGVETFDQVSFVFAFRSDRDLHTLRELEIVRSRRGLGRSLVRFLGASFMAELLLVHTLQEAGPELYAGVGGALDRLESAPEGELPAVVLAAAWGLLAAAGFPPALEGCVRCGADLPPDGLLVFTAAAGGLLCPRCGAGREGARLGPTARADLRRLAEGDAPGNLRGARAHLSLVEGHALHHLAPRRAFRSPAMLRPFFEGNESETGETA